jgi:colanic acid/amylovoran biosynthesis protein
MSGGPKRFLIVNQHGENRGDEAAMRAMIRAIEARFPGSSFAVIAQLRSRDLRLSVAPHDIAFHNMVLPVADAGALVLYAAMATVGVRIRRVLPRRVRAIVSEFESADVVVTAPGGPYFGDIYAGHELVHWFFIYLGRLHGKRVFQYAPSCGPFRNRALNPLRRRFYRWIDVLVVREDVSHEHLRSLLGPDVPVHVSADSAIQDDVRAASREEYFTGTRACLRDRFLVAVTLQQYRFPGDPHPGRRQAAYERAVLACLEHLADVRGAHVLFFPQLYGGVHGDASFHRYIGGRLPAGVTWEVVDPSHDSDVQRALIGMTDFSVSSRYHPQIFATMHGIPGLFVWYEHKQLGYLKSLGLERFAFSIREPDAAAMRSAIDEALQRREELSAAIRERARERRRHAARTTELLEAFVLRGDLPHAAPAPAIT